MKDIRPGWLWKVVPLLFVLVVILAGGTNVFSAAVHQLVAKVLQELATKVAPFAINCVIGVVIICLAKHLYSPMLKGMHKLLDSGHATLHHKNLVKRIIQAAYWLIVVFLVASIVAPDLLTKLIANLILFGAAVVVALQDMAKDIAGGFVLQFSPTKKCDVGETITLIGMEAVTGTVKDIGLLSTIVETEKGIVTVPNRELWARAVLKSS